MIVHMKVYMSFSIGCTSDKRKYYGNYFPCHLSLNYREMLKIDIYIPNFLLGFSAFLILSKSGVYHRVISVLETHNKNYPWK